MLDTAIILIYFFITLIFGFYKGSNIKSMSDYAVGSRSYALPIMVATITATWICGGTTFGFTESIHSQGIALLLVAMGEPLNLIVAAFFLIKRFEIFDHNLSVGEIIGDYYGKWPRVITGLCGALSCAGIVGAQVSVVGLIAHYFLDMPYILGVVFGCGIVILYSAFGGIRAVTATDVIQFAVILVAIPMVCNVGIHQVGGIKAFFSQIPPHLLELPHEPTIIINYIFMCMGFGLPFLDPAIMQRLLMAKNQKQRRSMLVIGGLVAIPVYLLVGIIGFVSAILYPGIESSLAFAHLINTTLPAGVKGIAVIGLFSVVMSTADSYLNAAGICLVHDTIKPLSLMSDKQELFITRLITLFLGIFATVVALSFSSILNMMLFSFNFWGPIIVIPLYAILLGFKVDTTCFFGGAICGAMTFTIWYFAIEPQFGISGLIPGLIGNFIGFAMTYHWQQNYRLARV